MTNVARTNESAWQYLAKFCIWTASENILKPRNKGTCSWMAKDDPYSKKKNKKNHKDNASVFFFFQFSPLCLCLMCMMKFPNSPKIPQVYNIWREWYTFQFLSMTVTWLSQEVCYLESTIFAYSAASLTNHSWTTGKGCHKTLIRWYQNKSCTNRTRSTIT